MSEQVIPVTTKTTNGAIVKAPMNAALQAKQTEKDLDTAVMDVEKLKTTGAVALYKLGQKIVEIQDRGLWKLRTEKKGDGTTHVRWKNFEAFCNTELGLTPGHASMLANVARHYNEDQVKLFGMKKCGLILQAPTEERPKLEAKAAGGASKREIEKEVRAVNRARGGAPAPATGKVNKAAKATAAAASARREKAKAKVKAGSSQITVAQILGAVQVKLHKRPAKIGADLEIDKLPRARKLTDEPFGMLQLSSDVKMYFHVAKAPNDELVLKVRTVRDEE